MFFLPMCARHGERREVHDRRGVKTISSRSDHRGGGRGGRGASNNDDNNIERTSDDAELMLIRSTLYSTAI